MSLYRDSSLQLTRPGRWAFLWYGLFRFQLVPNLTKFRQFYFAIMFCFCPQFQKAQKYCLRVWYLSIFDSFEASQAVYWNLWFIKSHLWKIICLLYGLFVISAQTAKKSTFWLPIINKYLTRRQYLEKKSSLYIYK